jgi:hypothetical protein
MSDPGQWTGPRSRRWPMVADSLPDSGPGLSLDRWADVRSQPRQARRVGPGWHAYRPAVALALPSWAVEATLTIEHPVVDQWSSQQSIRPQALLLLRSASAVGAMALAVAEAAAQVEEIAGVGRREPDLHLARSIPELGLQPLATPTVLSHLRLASQRGLAARPRRRSSTAPGSTWEAGPGAVLTCSGSAGISAQAVVSLQGRGDPGALRPPDGGALLVRAWRPGRVGRRGLTSRASAVASDGLPRHPEGSWALVSALVLASTNASGLGRAARRLTASIRAGNWEASVLTGPAAMEVARTGDPHHPVPRVAARWATEREVTELLTSCLLAGLPA